MADPPGGRPGEPRRRHGERPMAFQRSQQPSPATRRDAQLQRVRLTQPASQGRRDQVEEVVAVNGEAAVP
jgi:hypothetical protein